MCSMMFSSVNLAKSVFPAEKRHRFSSLGSFENTPSIHATTKEEDTKVKTYETSSLEVSEPVSNFFVKTLDEKKRDMIQLY